MLNTNAMNVWSEMMKNNWSTQAEDILRVLDRAGGEWVPLPEVMMAQGPGTIIASHTRRIKDLKERGHSIENKVKHIDGVVYSWYRLERDDEPD